MVLRSFEDLVAFFESKQVPHSADPNTQMMVIPTILRDEHSECYLRFHAERGLVLCMQPLDVPVDDPDARHRLAEALLRINHGLALPGMGYDYPQQVAYFRHSVTFDIHHGFEVAQLQALFGSTIQTAARFLEPLREVCRGNAAPEQVLELAALEMQDKADLN